MDSFVTINGHSLRVRSIGSGQHAIIFLHAASLSIETWQEQLSLKEFSLFRLIAIDFPGHGRSARSETPSKTYSLPAFGAMLGNFLQTLDVEKFILVGISLGSSVIAEATLGLKKCSGIFLASPLLLNDTYHPGAVLKPSPVAHVFTNRVSPDEDIIAFMKFSGSSPTEEQKRYVLDCFAITSDPAFREAIGQNLQQGKWSDQISNLNKFRFPICIAVGENEGILDTAYLENLPILKWKNKIHRIAGAGHMVHWDQPTVFNHLLMAYSNDRFSGYTYDN